MSERKTCTKCKRELPLDSFCKDKNRKDGLNPWCRDCRKKHYADNRERFLGYARKYRETHREQKNEYYRKNREKRNKINKNFNLKLKLEVFHKLSDPIKCAHCSITDVRVLCVDHINNNGREERRRLHTLGVYRKIVKMPLEKAREEYQVLCRNCNWIKLLEHREGN